MNVFLAVVLATIPVSHPPGPETGSYLYQPAYAMDHALRGPAGPYAAQAGDIILAASNDLKSVIGHVLAGSGYPNHSMIVIRTREGGLGVLEAGPHGRLREGMAINNDVLDHLRSYEAEGRVWVRRRIVPLTEEESARLTEYAYAEEGKRFAFIRVYSQASILRSRMPVRAAFMGKPNPDKASFFCSELVMNGVCYAGLIDGELARPACTYPRDLFFGQCSNIFVNRGLKQMACGWDPPARWSSGQCEDMRPTTAVGAARVTVSEKPDLSPVRGTIAPSSYGPNRR